MSKDKPKTTEPTDREKLLTMTSEIYHEIGRLREVVQATDTVVDRQFGCPRTDFQALERIRANKDQIRFLSNLIGVRDDGRYQPTRKPSNART
jgi:hypothetical protein